MSRLFPLFHRALSNTSIKASSDKSFEHKSLGASSICCLHLRAVFFMLFIYTNQICGLVLFFNFSFAKRFFSFHSYLRRVISAPQVLLSNFILSLCRAMNHASLLPSGDIQIPGSSSSLYPLFFNSFEASGLVSILPPISWVTWGLRYPLAYRPRWGWSGITSGSDDFTSRSTASSVAVAIMIVVIIVVIMMYVQRCSERTRTVILSNVYRIGRITSCTSSKNYHE